MSTLLEVRSNCCKSVYHVTWTCEDSHFCDHAQALIFSFRMESNLNIDPLNLDSTDKIRNDAPPPLQWGTYFSTSLSLSLSHTHSRTYTYSSSISFPFFQLFSLFQKNLSRPLVSPLSISFYNTLPLNSSELRRSLLTVCVTSVDLWYT